MKLRGLLFPKQNHNVLSHNLHTHVSVNDLYIPRIGLPIFLQPIRLILGIYKSLTDTVHECRNRERGRTVSFQGIHKSDFRYSEDQFQKYCFIFFGGLRFGCALMFRGPLPSPHRCTSVAQGVRSRYEPGTFLAACEPLSYSQSMQFKLSYNHLPVLF
jgi:hypothetical protein